MLKNVLGVIYHVLANGQKVPISKAQASCTLGSKAVNGLAPTTTLRRELLYRQEGCCWDCGIEEWRYKRSFQIHRLKKKSDGGLYTIDNCVLVCAKCHVIADRGQE